jgi:flavorubredoxin
MGPPIKNPQDDELLDWAIEGKSKHSSQSAFVILDDKTLLFETLTPASKNDILEKLDKILNGRDLDYLAISHPEANHAGNTFAILREYPNATLIAPQGGVHHELFGLNSRCEFVGHGDELNLGRYELEFLEPIFFDHAMHTWMKERTTGMLWTVDFLGFPHLDGECVQTADQLESEITPNRIRQHQATAFAWLRFADIEARVDSFRGSLNILSTTRSLRSLSSASQFSTTSLSVIR